MLVGIPTILFYQWGSVWLEQEFKCHFLFNRWGIIFPHLEPNPRKNPSHSLDACRSAPLINKQYTAIPCSFPENSWTWTPNDWKRNKSNQRTNRNRRVHNTRPPGTFLDHRKLNTSGLSFPFRLNHLIF